MEDLCRKIPLISKSIFEELDDQSFVNFKDASREISTNLKNERFYWIRVLRSYNCLLRDFKDSWSIVVNRTPAEFVRKIVALIDQFYKDDCYAEDKTFFLPQHIAACLGKLDFYKGPLIYYVSTKGGRVSGNGDVSISFFEKVFYIRQNNIEKSLNQNH